MFIVASFAFIAFAIIGWVRATRRGGTLGDRVQFALAHAIPATLVAMAVQILLVRLFFTG